MDQAIADLAQIVMQSQDRATNRPDDPLRPGNGHV